MIMGVNWNKQTVGQGLAPAACTTSAGGLRREINPRPTVYA